MQGKWRSLTLRLLFLSLRVDGLQATFRRIWARLFGQECWYVFVRYPQRPSIPAVASRPRQASPLGKIGADGCVGKAKNVEREAWVRSEGAPRLDREGEGAR